MSTLTLPDWREKAAAAVQDDEAIEKAFMDQSYQQVSNKLKPLMKSPYRIGFEIIKKNDGNSRMVGIYAFRISDDMVYAPVFFLNGDVKGTDLLYRVNPKKFVPANEDWANYLIEQDKDNTGRGVSKDIRRQSQMNVDLTKINRPPAYLHSVKYASRRDEPLLTEAQKDALLEEWTKSAALGPVLREFLVEDGGLDCIEKIASAIDQSHAFAEALVSNVKEEDYLPVELIQRMQKSAAAKQDDKLVLFTGDMFKAMQEVPAGEHEKAASTMADKGFYLMDKRASTEISVITVDAAPHALTAVTSAGVYNVVTQTGGDVKAFCATLNDDYIGDCNADSGDMPAPIGMGNATYSSDVTPKPEVAVVELSGKKATGVGREVLGEEVVDTDWRNELVDTMKSNTAYRIFDSSSGTLSRPIFVLSKETKNGITLYEVLNHTGDYCSSVDIRHNPDYTETRLSEGILGSTAKFIEVGGKADERDDANAPSSTHHKYYTFHPNKLSLGGADALHNWIMNSGTPVDAVELQNINGTEFFFKTGPKKQTERMSKTAAFITLVSQLHAREDDAERVIKQACEKKYVRFYVEAPMAKRASVTRLIREPNFITGYDHTYNTDVELPQRFVLPTETEQFPAPDQRVGDAHDPSMGQGPVQPLKRGGKPDGIPQSILIKMAPEQMSSFAQQHDLPHVFEHGVMGSLLSTYDSSAMIDKYLPKIEDALDAVGRTLFLFYWKPTDFQKLYGVDDMTSLENELLSNFKSWGDMTLNLTKKSQIKNNGSVAFAG